jgi:hypothetical protein
MFLSIGLLALPNAAAGQSERRGPAGSRVELGVEAGAVSLFPTYGGHVSVSVVDGHSLELVGSGLAYMPWERHATFFVGQAQWRGAFNRRPGRQLFITVGGTVSLRYDHPPEVRFTRPDGSIFVQPETRSWAVEGPTGFHIGVGGQHAVRGRTAIRWDAQMIVHTRYGVLPVGRATFGVVQLLGRAQ